MLLLYECAITRSFRLVLDAGYVHNGTRDPAGRYATFDVPDAVRWDFGAAVHIGEMVMLSGEFRGLHYFDRMITPVWEDNQHLVEFAPGLRLEVTPGLVLEAALGFGLTRAVREMHLVRLIAGLTYEFPVY